MFLNLLVGVISFTFTFSIAFAETILFQPEIRWNEPHTISFVHSTSQKNWGKAENDLIKIKCQKDHKLDIQWLNSKTVKAVLDPQLSPAENCEAVYLGKKYAFSAPKIQILEIGPWLIADRMNENDPIYIKSDFSLDKNLLLKEITIQVDGLDEKIELDLIDDKIAAELNKEYNNNIQEKIVWVKPRRTLPNNHALKIDIKKGQSLGMIREARTREEFTVETSCTRTKAEEPCIPLEALTLRFNESIDINYLKEIYYLHNGKKIFPKKSEDDTTGYVSFPAPLPADSEIEIYLPKDVKDLSGRTLTNINKFPLKIKIGEFPPLAKLPGTFGILEASKDAAVPISVRNLEQPVSMQINSANLKSAKASDIFKWLNQISERQYARHENDLRNSSFFTFNHLKAKQQKLTTSVSSQEIEVLGMPLTEKGLYVVEVVSPKLGETLLKTPDYFFVSSMVLVTNISLQLKTGNNGVLVWATSLDKGMPLEKVKVELFDCEGKPLANSITNQDGVAQFKLERYTYNNCRNSLYSQYGTLMAKATLDDDMSFTFSSWNEGIEAWRFQLPYGETDPVIRYHTVFDRPLYQQKDKVSFLIMARDQEEKGLVIPHPFSEEIMITHSGSEKSWFDKVKWSDLGTAASSFKIPDDAPLGHYSIALVNKDQKGQVRSSQYVGSFRVEAVKIPLTKLKMQWKDQQDTFLAKKANSLLGSLHYLSGGIASDVEINIRGEVNKSYSYKDQFTWANGDISQYDNGDSSDYKIDKKTLVTDKDGSFKYTPEGFQKRNYVQQVSFELEYMDPNGKYQSRYQDATIYPANTIVGIKSIEDSNLKKPVVLTMKVQDSKGKLVSGAKVQVDYFKRVYKTVRKKIIGGFYSYDSHHENISIGEVCQGKTNEKGILTCEIKLNEGGQYLFQARTKDDDGNESVCFTSEHIYSQDSWSPLQAHDRADLIADKEEYAANDTAKLEFKIPFEKAKVLVTKERADIIEYKLINWERQNPFISISLSEKDAPNMYVSALAVRGREQEAQVTGLVDLGRPALRMGLTHLSVKVKKELPVTVTPQKTVYEVRDSVNLKLKVDLQKLNPAKVKVVMAVFDEGLLQLSNANSFDITNAFIQNWSHNISTASAYVQVIGKRHFGLKAKPHGGGGGKQISRELFDTILYWNPAISLNKNGEAEIQFKLNDSLTSFKIRVLAYSEEYFGLAESSIRSTQDVLTFSGLSSVLRTEDQTMARYQLKNTTSKNLDLTLLYQNSLGAKNEIKVKLNPEENKNVEFPYTASRVAHVMDHTLLVKNGEKTVDQMKNKQTILPLHKPVITQADLIEVNKEATLQGEKSSPDLAGMKIDFASSILGSPEGIKSYMENYIFNCLEQRLAKAVVLNNSKMKDQIIRDLPTYLSSDGLLRFYPANDIEASGFLTAHFLETAFWNKWELPKNLTEQMETGLAQVAEGKINFRYITPEMLGILKLKAMATLRLRKSAHFQDKWMSLISQNLEKDTLESLEYKWMIWGLSQKQNESDETLNMIRNRLTVKASAMELNPRPEDFGGYWMNNPTTLFARFLLLQTLIPTQKDFQQFYKENKVKFLKGFTLHKKYGNYGDTLSNTFASLLHQRVAPYKKVDGKTQVNSTLLTWEKTEPSLSLDSKAQSEPLIFKHLGSGAVYPTISYLHWPDPKENVTKGFTITAPNLDQEFKQGERLELIWKIKADYNSRPVVMQIPIAPGASVLKVEIDGQASLIYQERDFAELRLYFEEMNIGQHQIKVTMRFDQPGTYQVPGLMVEEMYSPDRRGLAAYATWVIR